MDRSGRTYEEYRQLYWDEQTRRKALEIEVENFRSDAYVLDLLTKLDAVRDLCDVDGRNIGDLLVRSSKILAVIGEGDDAK